MRRRPKSPDPVRLAEHDSGNVMDGDVMDGDVMDKGAISLHLDFICLHPALSLSHP